METKAYRTADSKGDAAGDRRSAVKLSEIDPSERGTFTKHVAEDETEALLERLDELQEMLFAQAEHKVLVVLQAIDAGGKDSTIRSIFGPLNSNGVSVQGFKAPTPIELAHDYLWRVHPHVPATGEIVVFNRSHYEDVLAVRVHKLVPEERWRRRYRHIREFERLLVEEGTTIIKLLLVISKDEQKQRFQDRLDDPSKHWKFRRGDLDDRKLWDEYQAAFQDMLDETSDPVPWWVIPADRKWFRNRLIAQIMVDTLEGLDLDYPDPEPDLDKVVIP